jgi:ParB family transcriptional regulator, chromosome partitioning protein
MNSLAFVTLNLSFTPSGGGDTIPPRSSGCRDRQTTDAWLDRSVASCWRSSNVAKRRLGRGLEALLGREEGGYEPSTTLEPGDLPLLAVDQIDPNPFQPRRHFDPTEIAALADSLRQHGMIQPVLVRAVNDRYQLIAGERRLRAAVEAQLHEIPVRVMDLDDQRVSELAMVENLQREDLNPLEKAGAFRDYLLRYGGTQDELAARLGIDRSTLSNLLRLLELPEEVQVAVRAKKITQGHARALLGLPEAETQRRAAERVIAEGLSVRQTEALVATGEPTPAKSRVRRDPAEPGATPSGGKAPHLLELEKRLQDRFGTPVLIKVKGPERGQIIIDFHTKTEFDRVTKMIRG